MLTNIICVSKHLIDDAKKIDIQLTVKFLKILIFLDPSWNNYSINTMLITFIDYLNYYFSKYKTRKDIIALILKLIMS